MGLFSGKKDTPDPVPRPEFPKALEAAGFATAVESSDEGEVSAAIIVPETSKDEAGQLREVLAHLGQLGHSLDQAKQQVLAYVIQRQSQAAASDEALSPAALAQKLDALLERLDHIPGDGGGGPALEKKFDALWGKLDQLAATAGKQVPQTEGNAPAATDAALIAAVRPMVEKLEQFDAVLRQLLGKSAAIDALQNAFVPTLTQVRDCLVGQHQALGGEILKVQQQITAIIQQSAALHQRVDAGMREIAEQLRPAEPEVPAAPPGINGDWQQAILGDLADNPALDFPRNDLLRGVLAGEPAACSLAGQLLIFRSSPAEKMPALLKDVGEAFYRWQPRTSGRPTEMEKALVAWLQNACDRAGISNTIELVHPGERFDSTRHSASQRGVEITEVLGWIVLRDNGKVYTKASVAVR